MKNRAVLSYLLLGGSLASAALWHPAPVHGASASSTNWDREAAAHYLDTRETWWQQWPRAQKDQGTICISCHTVVPYAMARPGLRSELSETTLPTPEKVMMESVEKRVTHWAEMVPFYSDAKNGPGKTAEAHATEAVLNAVILASVDARQGRLRPVTRTAFDNAWALQEDTGDLAGAWKWQDFHFGPWEASESNYQGAALFMVEALNAPDNYAREPEVRRRLDRLRDYLRGHYTTQPLMNQLYVLWASAKDPALLSPAEKTALLGALRGQQQADGGWRTTSIDHRERIDHSPEPTESDGYATGLSVLAIEESGTPRPSSDISATLQRGVAWLAGHQQKDGAWTAVSINKVRPPDTDPALFMTDAATAYAALALEKAK
jgi:squalene-hopene/tetraprenyl-beta-curcumene cyclase